MNRALGVDVGGVIIDTSDGGIANPLLGEGEFVHAQAHHFAFSVLKDINELFEGEVYVISKCHEKMRRKINRWMDFNDFSRRTAIPSDHVYFCRERADKAPLCWGLGLTDFVDDHLDVLRYLHFVPNRYLFQGHSEDMERYKGLLPSVYQVQDWLELGQKLHSSFRK